MKIHSYSANSVSALLVCIFVHAVLAAETYYVATDGNDSNDGKSLQTPFKRIQKAADVMHPGDTVLIRGGEYREKIVPLRGGTSEEIRITYRNYADETPVIKGSERVTGWVDQGGGVWMADLPAEFFRSSPYNPFAKVASGACLFVNDHQWTLGMVYLDGRPFSERKSLDEVRAAPQTWYAKPEATTTTLYARFDADPNVAVAEVNVRDSCFHPGDKVLNYISIHGLTLKQAAPNWSGNAYPQQGIVTVFAGKGWRIERCAIADSPCSGIALAPGSAAWDDGKSAVRVAGGTVPDFNASGFHVVRHNTIERCGQAGIVGLINGHSSIIEGNLIQDINGQQKLGGAESAGIKLHWSIDALIKNNVIRRIFTTPAKDYSCHFGLWLDWANQGARVTGNLIYDVYGLGKNPQNWPLYLEANAGPVVVDNNIIIKHPDNTCTYSYLKCLNCVFAHNLVVKGGVKHENDSERNFPWYEPHSFRLGSLSKGKGMPERFVDLNNLYLGGSMTNGDNDRKQNIFISGEQGFTCASTPTGAVISLEIDDEPAASQLITQASIGIFTPMDQGMADRESKPYDLDSDINGIKRQASSLAAGPFATLAKGRHRFVITAGHAATSFIAPADASSGRAESPSHPVLSKPPVFSSPALAPEHPIFELHSLHPKPIIKAGDAHTAGIQYGFEGGTIFMHQNTYHLFTAEMYGKPMWIKMRLGHWTSPDGFAWKREGTLLQGTGEFTGRDRRASLWSPMPFFNPDHNRWEMYYVAYRQKPITAHNPVHCDGQIWRAASEVSGPGGLGGPYTDLGVIMKPDSTSGAWEGVQGVDSFFLFPTKDGYHAFFGSYKKEPGLHFWGAGLCKAPKMEGPWTRCNELNPVLLDPYFTENPVVTRLPDGTYVAMFDAGINGCFGYSTSTDGIHWRKGTLVNMERHPDKWWSVMRTPLSCIPEGNGIYRVYFTAYDNDPFQGDTTTASGSFPPSTDGIFGCLGMCRLKLKEGTTQTHE